MLHRSSSSWLWFWSPTPFLKNTAITCAICSTFMMCGCARTFVSYLVAQLTRESEEWRNGVQRISDKEASWLCSLSPLTNPIGFLLGGYVMDVFGRKSSVICALFPFAAGWAIIFHARHLNELYAAGVIHGIASGMSVTASAYISELSSPQLRGFFLSLLPLSYMLGTVVCSALVWSFGWAHGAAYLLALSTLTCAFAFLVPESPYWLVLNGSAGAAVKVLESIREDDDTVENEIKDIKRCAAADRRSSRANAAVVVVSTVEAHAAASSTASPPKTRKLEAVWRARRQIGILATLAILHKFTGFTPLAQYTVQFFEQLHSPLDGETASFVHTMVCFGSTFAVPYFAHNHGKRPLLFVTSVLAGLCMTLTLAAEFDLGAAARATTKAVAIADAQASPTGEKFGWLSLLGVYGYDACITVGVTSVLVMLPAELLPAEVSGIACAIFSILCSVITTAAVKTYLTLFAAVGLLNMLSSFVVCCFVVAFFSATVLPETRGKTLNEIQKTYFNGDVGATAGPAGRSATIGPAPGISTSMPEAKNSVLLV